MVRDIPMVDSMLRRCVDHDGLVPGKIYPRVVRKLVFTDTAHTHNLEALQKRAGIRDRDGNTTSGR